ncbi:hypothetical protein [Streptomyces sp. NPDC087856]
MNRGEGVVREAEATLASTPCRDGGAHGLGDRRDVRVHGVYFLVELP